MSVATDHTTCPAEIAERLPKEFVERLSRIVPQEQYARCLQSFAVSSVVGARVNTLLADPEETLSSLRSEGFEVHRVPWFAEAFWLPPAQRECLLHSRWVQEGFVYVQNLSSMLPPLALSPRPGERVLDLCAAPGGKTLILAAMMQRQEDLVAVEAVRARFFKMRQNLRHYGAGHVQTIQAQGEWVWKRWRGQFDAVLLDAPCSSEGRFRVDDPTTFRFWSPQKIADMARKQKSLLYSGIQCLKPGGRLVYCTCTLAPEENEAVVTHALKKFGQRIEVLPLPVEIEGMTEALTEWEGRPFAEAVRYARRILPSPQMEAFFLCLIGKKEGDDDAP